MQFDIDKKQLIEIVVVIAALGIGIFFYDYFNNKNFDGSIERNAPGTGEKTEEYCISINGKKEKVQVKISEQVLTDEEIDEAFVKAIDEINESILGRNESLDDVEYDLLVNKTYVDGLVKADWEFSDYKIIGMDGVINSNAVDDMGNLIEGKVTLSYGARELVKSFSFIVQPVDLETEEGQRIALEKALIEADEMDKTSESFLLPEEIKGQKLSWYRDIDYRGIKIAILGLVAALALVYGKKLDGKKLREEKMKALEADYPQIVSELSILLSAGMSFRRALERMVKKYLEKKAKSPDFTRAGYEELVLTYRQIEDGLGELSAIENLSMRCENKDYRKLALLLIQNIKKGSKDLIFALEKEEQVAFEMRKQRAVRLGEEASTKMLLPLGGMLLIVVVILMVPALMQMKM